jgi:hypothetical protein
MQFVCAIYIHTIAPYTSLAVNSIYTSSVIKIPHSCATHTGHSIKMKSSRHISSNRNYYTGSKYNVYKETVYALLN